jgi:predicted NBD/HSP70 family sugar kinase
VIETAHFPTVQGQMQTTANSSCITRKLRTSKTRLFFVFLSTPSEKATIVTMPAGPTPDLGPRRSGGSGDLRQGNLTQILRYVRDHGASSRHDIAHGCGLGISTMTDLIGELRARRIVMELDPIRRLGAGRPTRPIDFDGEPWCVLGVRVDLDGFEFAAATLAGRELWRDSVPANLRGTAPDAGFAELDRALRSQLNRLPAEKHLIAIEIGVPGYIAADRAIVGLSENPEWRDFPLSAKVSATLNELGIHGVHVGITNDSQLAALHAVRNELRLEPDTIAAYLGGLRSIGSGLIINGEIFRGAGGGAGDLGHLNVDPSGPACWCGRNGCLQSLIGPQNLLTVGELMPPDEAARLVDEQPKEAIRRIVEAIDEGQAAMLQILKRAGTALGDAIDDVIGIVNPHTVILGGYLGALSPYLMDSIQERISHRVTIPAFASTKIVAVDQGVSRVIGGAVLAARDACFYDPLTLTRSLSHSTLN